MDFPKIISLPVGTITRKGQVPDFTRESEDGEISCFVNPKEELVFQFSSDYIWKKTIQVIGSVSGDVINYVIPLEIDYEAEKMRSDFADIRFTLDDGTILSYNLLNVQQDKAVFEVKIPFIHMNSQVNVNIYVGKPEATVTTSDPHNTYLFYDDASGDTSKWGIWSLSGVYTLDIVNEEFKLTTGYRDRVGAIFGSDIPLGTGLKINATIKANSGTKCLALSLGNYGANDVIYGNASNSPCASYSYTNGYGRHGVHIDNTVTGNTYPLPNTYYPIELIVTPTYLKSTFNGETLTQTKSPAWGPTQTFNYQFQDDDDYSNNDGIIFDNVTIRPFIDPEPICGTATGWTKVSSSEYP